MNLHLDHIRQQIANLLQAVPELAEDDVLRADMVEGSTDAREFLTMIERKRKEAAAFVIALGTQVHELNQRLERYARREKAMRSIMFEVLQAAGERKVELPEATLSVGNRAPKVIITDESILPDIACRFKREPDKTKIKELLQTDPFFVAGATLSNSEPTLTVRVK